MERKLQSPNPGVAEQFARRYGVLPSPDTSEAAQPSAARVEEPTVPAETWSSAPPPPGAAVVKVAKADLAFSFEAWLKSVRKSPPTEE